MSRPSTRDLSARAHAVKTLAHLLARHGVPAPAQIEEAKRTEPHQPNRSAAIARQDRK